MPRPTLTRVALAGAAILATLVLLLVLVGDTGLETDVEPAAPATAAATEPHPGFLYGRITTADGDIYEGRLRWGGDQEAFWGDYFDGAKQENRWAALAGQPEPRRPIEIFGFAIGGTDRADTFGRPFMARFGDLARVEADFDDVRVTLKSGTIYVLDRFSAGDIDDGVRVWDARHGVIDVDAREIRTIEFVPTPPLAGAPVRLHGTVQTRLDNFTGFLQWDREDGVGDDELEGRSVEGERRVRFGAIRSIARQSRDTALITLADGGEVVLSGSREIGPGNRGIYVDDGRYGRVLVRWDAFERLELAPRGSGPAYADFPPGRPLAGRVTTRDGRRLAGRLVYDFDESETTDTFDVSRDGVDYNIPLGLVASIVPRDTAAPGPPRARVTLHDGEALHVERNGDVAERNAGVLIFVSGHERPEHVRWIDVERIDFDRATE